MLDVMGIYDVDRTLTQLDRHVDGSKRQLDASKRKLVNASRQAAIAVYPWLMMAPFGLLIAVKSRAAIRANGRASRAD
jgi:hypothetical protein